ncbi:hypothetical protein FXB41_28745 [Bradyrhizobium canariense]|uniref:hypothetical protein n=1 Tax=Bradyrhizobium canariense TaxID=255045 RepID=UPI001CA4EDBE|nr:hypothetical protein [Bradyrhizobium canariense]MBW5438607.1 hypothetical protein [Bradyrhizobium canariense]
MYQNPERTEYEAIVGRLRGHFGSGIDIGGYTRNDLMRLRKLDAQRAAEVARAQAAQPLNDAIGQLALQHRRAIGAWQQIALGQKGIAENRREHQILGFDVSLVEPVEMPKAIEASSPSIEAYDKATAEMSRIATDLESRARKLNSAVSQWAQSTPDQQNRSLILAIADRLDGLEGRLDG